MKIFPIFLLMLPLSLTAQPKIKKVLIEGTGSPLVMLNGGTLDMTVYTTHSKELSRTYKVIRMEQFNVQYANEGLTLPKDYSVQMESEAIKFTLDSLNIKEPIVLLGHSYGGVIAFDFALNHSDRVRSLILVEPPLFNLAKIKNESPEGMHEMEELGKRFTPQAEITEEMLIEFRCNLTNCDSLDLRKDPRWPNWLKQKNRMRGLSAGHNYQLDLKKLHQFKKPVLIVTGTETVTFHKRIDELLAAEFSSSQTASIKGGHGAINTNPKEFIDLLLNFLQ